MYSNVSIDSIQIFFDRSRKFYLTISSITTFLTSILIYTYLIYIYIRGIYIRLWVYIYTWNVKWYESFVDRRIKHRHRRKIFTLFWLELNLRVIFSPVDPDGDTVGPRETLDPLPFGCSLLLRRVVNVVQGKSRSYRRFTVDWGKSVTILFLVLTGEQLGQCLL